MVITADGEGVPCGVGRKMSPGPTTAGPRGGKANKEQMACVVSVYSIEPFVRKAEDIIDEVLRDRKAQEGPDRNTSTCGRR